MKNLRNFNIYNRLRNLRLHSLVTLFVFAGILSATGVFAQKNSDGAELRLAKRQNLFSGDRRYRTMPEENLALPKVLNRNSSAAAGGDIDSTFNASVTEGFGYVSETIVQPDGKIIAAGSYHRANGTRVGGIARFNADGTLDNSFNAGAGATGIINSVSLQPDGKIIVAGTFTLFNNQVVRRIVRLNPDGSMDTGFSLLVNFNSTINDVELQPDGKILVGGLFTVSSARLVRLNTDGTLDIAFSGLLSNVNAILYTSSGKIVIGKAGTSADNPALVRYNSNGTPDGTFSIGSGTNSQVTKVAIQPDGKILASGSFTVFNGTPTDGLARVNDNGSLDTAFDYLTDPTVNDQTVDSMELQPDGKILIGYYYQTETDFFSRVSRLNSNGTIDATFTTGAADDEIIKDFNVLSDGKILVGGSFVSYNTQTKLHLVKLNSDGSSDNTFNPSISAWGLVYAIKKQADGKIVIGGDFEFVNGVRKRGIARLNTDGTLDNSFNMGTGFNGDVFALLIQPDGNILAGGNFLAYNGTPTFSFARINSDGTFNANLNNYSKTDNVGIIFVYALGLQSDGKIIVGGSVFLTNTGLQATAARVNPNGTIDNTFTSYSVVGGTTRAIAVQPDNKIIIGGTFTNQATFPRNGIARLNSDGTIDSAFNFFSSAVYALARQPDGKILVGSFGVGRYSAEGTGDSSFNTGTGINGLVRAIEVQPDGKILIGGNFNTFNGAPANAIVRVNSNGSLDSTFNAGTTGVVLSLAVQSDGKILAGGQFVDFNNTEKLSIVRLKSSVTPLRAPFDFDGDNKTDISIFRPSNGEWWYRRSIDGGNYAAQFGNNADKLVPGDYTGDGRADIAIWRPSTGEWFILRSEDGSYYSFPFGTSGDIPTVGDFDGDGKADQAVFRPSDTTWYIRRSSDSGFTIQQFGASGDAPAVADYDGDGKSDIAIWRVSVGEWWIQKSSNSSVVAFQFGNSNDKPVQGDYTGDGKADVAIYRPVSGEWFILRSEDFSYYSFPFGAAGDIPTPGDYDGDGRADAAVFRPSDMNWYLQRTTAGFTAIMFGFSTDKPVPNVFVP